MKLRKRRGSVLAQQGKRLDGVFRSLITVLMGAETECAFFVLWVKSGVTFAGSDTFKNLRD